MNFLGGCPCNDCEDCWECLSAPDCNKEDQNKVNNFFLKIILIRLVQCFKIANEKLVECINNCDEEECRKCDQAHENDLDNCPCQKNCPCKFNKKIMLNINFINYELFSWMSLP